MQNLINKAFAWKQARPIEIGDEGQTVVEYALVVAVISVVLIGLVLGFGTAAVNRAKTAVDGVLAA